MTQQSMAWNRVRPRLWRGMLPLALVALVAGSASPLKGQDIEPIVAIQVLGA